MMPIGLARSPAPRASDAAPLVDRETATAVADLFASLVGAIATTSPARQIVRPPLDPDAAAPDQDTESPSAATILAAATAQPSGDELAAPRPADRRGVTLPHLSAASPLQVAHAHKLLEATEDPTEGGPATKEEKVAPALMPDLPGMPMAAAFVPSSEKLPAAAITDLGAVRGGSEPLTPAEAEAGHEAGPLPSAERTHMAKSLMMPPSPAAALPPAGQARAETAPPQPVPITFGARATGSSTTPSPAAAAPILEALTEAEKKIIPIAGKARPGRASPEPASRGAPDDAASNVPGLLARLNARLGSAPPAPMPLPTAVHDHAPRVTSGPRPVQDHATPPAATHLPADGVRASPSDPFALGLFQSAPAEALQSVSEPASLQSAEQMMEQQLDLARDSEWLDSLARDIARAGSTDAPLRFRLHPEYLGSLEVQVSQSDTGTAVRMTAETAEARAIIAEAQPKLIAEARAQGLRISESHVDLGSHGGSADPHRRQDHAPAARTAPAASDPAPEAPRRGPSSDLYA